MRRTGRLARNAAPSAEQVAASYQLDFLDFVAADGSIVSSAEFPARFGYKDDWQNRLAELNDYIATGEPMVFPIRTPVSNSAWSVSIFWRPPRP